MPLRTKRKSDFDPNKSDSEDETYGTSASKPGRSQSSRAQGTSARKRQRPQRSAEDSDGEIVEESEIGGMISEDEIEDDEIEVGPSGRPRRKAATRQPKYEESDSEDSMEAIPVVRKRIADKMSLVVKLRTPRQSVRARRSTWTRSGSAGATRPTSSSVLAPSTRRSSRIAHDESEPVIALTNSGNHVDVLRAGTRSPIEAGRPTRGGKGIKKRPASSVVHEDTEDSSARMENDFAEAGDAQLRGYRTEVAASMEDLGEDDEVIQQAMSEPENAQKACAPHIDVEVSDGVAIVPESSAEDGDDDEEEDPISKPGHSLRHREIQSSGHSADELMVLGGMRSTRRALRSTLGKRKARSSQRSGQPESSDFEPGLEEGAEEDFSESSASSHSPRKAAGQNEDEDSSPRRKGAKRRRINPRSRRVSDEHDSEVAEELAEELDELKGSRSRRAARAAIVYDDRKTRERKPVDYRILRPDLNLAVDDEGEPSATTPSRRGRGGATGAWQRSLFSTYGPFGGAGGPAPVLGGPGGIGAVAGADSDSSDDEFGQRPRATGAGGLVGMTPTNTHHASLSLLPPPSGQLHGADAPQGTIGTPVNVGKIKDKSALADADPLGVDQHVNFDGVGGLRGHIDQLKEMVALPLLYPEIFQRFHVTPPRGVLFHGPPGTGKTLLARALASSVSSQGRKVTFYMRKGADALSKWVGEAERQLRLLFEEARKNQPSIIFFDEIDGKCNKATLSFSARRLIFTRSRTRPIKQAGADTCFYCLDSTGTDGRYGWSRSSHCHWSHQSS